jgi:hypothetical protein
MFYVKGTRTLDELHKLKKKDSVLYMYFNIKICPRRGGNNHR